MQKYKNNVTSEYFLYLKNKKVETKDPSLLYEIVIEKILFFFWNNIDIWFERCKKYIGGIHLQQTDGLYDRHWDFTNPNGIITPDEILNATKKAGLDDIYQYLEVVTAYEEKDEIVFENMKKTMDFLHKNLGV